MHYLYREAVLGVCALINRECPLLEREQPREVEITFLIFAST